MNLKACSLPVAFVGVSIAAGYMLASPEGASGTDCFVPSGPDVIVGIITGPSNYDAVGDIEAFSIGTTSCNIGDANLDWIANSTDHPVIGQALYRLKDNRFEMIGQSWLKHGFGALQLDDCCTCTGSGNWQALGVGCSDPYGSGLNGQQSGLGPKFEVNAATGAFLWPPTDIDLTGDEVYKRLQVAISDIDPTQDGGGQYFVEAQYIHPDDAAAGNDHNNASHRPCDINGSGTIWNMTLTGTTQRERPALYAWQDQNPAVSIRTVSIPSEGQLHMAWLFTDNGDGTFHYEFALHNLNSDRSVGGFGVPLPVGSTVTNGDFHDVHYHSGEPYPSTDWVRTEGTDEIRWDTEDHATNSDANALRWGTAYNFRFDSPVDPSLVTEVTIKLFKPGTPSEMTVPLIPDAPAGDLCTDPIVVGDGAVPFDTTSADTDGPVHGTCATSGPFKDMWFRYQADCNGDLALTTCGSSFDTAIAVYDGAHCGSLSLLGCNDDGSCAPGSELTVPVINGNDYLIRIGGSAATDAGTGTLSVTGPGGCDNDHCADALPFNDGNGDGVVQFDTTGSDTDGPTHASCQYDGQTYNDIWFTFQTSNTGTMTVTTCDDLHGQGAAGYDTDLVVYGPYVSVAAIDCGAAALEAALADCNDDDSGNPCGQGPPWASTVQIPVIAGDFYLLRVGGYNAADQGSAWLSVTAPSDCPADLNGDGSVNVLDLLDMLTAWGANPGHAADLNGDGSVNVSDLLELLTVWGPC